MAQYKGQIQNQRLQNDLNQDERQSNNQNLAHGNQITVRTAIQLPVGQRNSFRQRFNEQSKQKLWQRLQHQDMQLFDDYHPFGLVFFSNQILQREAIQLFPHEVILMLEWDNWTLNVNSQDDAYMWERRLELMKECQITYLEVKISKQVKLHYIPSAIESIGFPDLLLLNLYSCNINNIQFLAHLNAPRLKWISLIYNQIYSYRQLNKGSFPLKDLFLNASTQIQNNYINAYKPYAILDNFSRWNFQLEDLRLEKHQYNSIGMNDLGFLAKSKFPKDNSKLKINIALKKRIPQKKIVRKFKEEAKLKFEIFYPLLEYDPQFRNLTLEDLNIYEIRH